MIGRWLREGRLWAVAAMVIVAALLPTTTVAASTFIYDAPADSHVDICAFDASAVGLSQLSDAQEASASPSAETRGAGATPNVVVDATNTVDDVLAGVRATGRAGEAASGIVGNTQRIPSLSGTAAYRIPDELGAGVLGEVNNVSSLSYTSQLRVFAAYAQQEGLQFNLYVRGSTTLSGPLQTAVDSGSMNLIRSLPG